jgi:hypothetical protein
MTDDRLDRLHHALDAVLDVDAGLRDATLAGRRRLVDDVLDDALDTSAGLRAILFGLSTSLSSRHRLNLLSFNSRIAQADPLNRLRLRPVLNTDTILAAREASRQWELLESDPHQVVFRTDRGFFEYFKATFRTELDDVFEGGPLGLDLFHSLDLDLDLIDRFLRMNEPTTARDLAHSVHLAREELQHVVSDFSGVDLADVDLTMVSLGGVRWSSGTRWPRGWEAVVREQSVKVGVDLFEVREDPWVMWGAQVAP